MKLITEIADALDKVREVKPLVHHITNYVTVNDCANVVLAAGGSPIMADDIEEVEDIVSISSALVLNIGTLNSRTISSSLSAGKKANAVGIPVVFDPVGAGASGLRNRTTERILSEVKVDVLRGNMSEIRFVAGLGSDTKGVEASEADQRLGLEAVVDVAKNVAKQHDCIVAITGATDVVTDGTRVLLVENGSEHMGNVTGTGCMCTSLVGAFCGAACEQNHLIAVAGGVLLMGLSGEIAYEKAGSAGYGAFRTAIIDAVSRASREVLTKRGRVHER